MFFSVSIRDICGVYLEIFTGYVKIYSMVFDEYTIEIGGSAKQGLGGPESAMSWWRAAHDGVSCVGANCANEDPTVSTPPQDSCTGSNCAVPEPAPFQTADSCSGNDCDVP